MTENEMTVLELNQASNISLEDILYLIQGTGADRDKKLTLAQLAAFLQTAFSAVQITSQGANSQLSSGSLSIAGAGGTVTINLDGISYVSDVATIRINNSGIKFSHVSGTYVEATSGLVKVSTPSGVSEIGYSVSTKNVNASGNATIAGKMQSGSAEIDGQSKLNGVVNVLDVLNCFSRSNFSGKASFGTDGVECQGDANVTGKVRTGNSFVCHIHTANNESDFPADAENGEIIMYKNTTGDSVGLAIYNSGSWHKISTSN